MSDDIALTHFSNQRVESVCSVNQATGQTHFKPRGLWVSVEGNEEGWLDWCIAESYRLDNLTHVHEVILSENANTLRLKNAGDIDVFTDQYEQYELSSHRTIRWDRVAKDYQGIIIAPYVWARRLHDGASWYYSWDCASGCIWDASAIAAIKFKGICVPKVLIETAESIP